MQLQKSEVVLAAIAVLIAVIGEHTANAQNFAFNIGVAGLAGMALLSRRGKTVSVRS